MLSVGRNDPCPCGSGKKYKKCCLHKENIIELAAHRREKFYVDKQHLVEKVGIFLKKQVPLKQYNQLKTEFAKRTENRIDKELEESFFTYWLYFYYRFDDHIRGVEWFYQDNEHRLTEHEKEMIETWIDMYPRFLQAIDQKDDVILFKDQLSGETFPISADEENIGHFIPWASTLAMIEPFDQMYYFNGFRFTVSPLQMEYGMEQLKKYAEEKNIEITTAIPHIFPELVATLLNNDQVKTDYGRDVSEHTLIYQITDQPVALEFLRSQHDFRIDKWLEDAKELVWAGDWRVYYDSENTGPLQLADVFGSIIVSDKDTRLTFQTMHPEKVDQLKERLQPIQKAITLVEDTSSVIGKFQIQVHNVLVSMDDDMPAYFAMYAQNDILQDVDSPIPVLNNLSIRECVNQGKQDIVDTWLKNAEHNLYKQILERFNTVEVTADFNTIRKEFRLPLSPFVTGGATRETSIEPIELEETSTRLLEEDIPYLENLGFTPDSMETFYISDFVRFYKEKTIGKSATTDRKYRNSLTDLRELFESSSIENWDECDQSFWTDLVTNKYQEWNPNYSKTERANFLSVIKTFLSWLDRTHQTKQFSETYKYLQSITK